MSTRTIQHIESEIQAIKDANPNWAGNQIVLGAITALKNEKNHLSQPLQGIVPFPPFPCIVLIVFSCPAPSSSPSCGIIF